MSLTALCQVLHFVSSTSIAGGYSCQLLLCLRLLPSDISCLQHASSIPMLCHRIQSVYQLWCGLQVKSGNDDMRQDAVMQQFFALINNVLRESPDTQKRKLRIVTYKVHCRRVLLSMQTPTACDTAWCRWC